MLASSLSLRAGVQMSLLRSVVRLTLRYLDNTSHNDDPQGNQLGSREHDLQHTPSIFQHTPVCTFIK